MGKRKKPLTLVALLREIGSAPGRYLAVPAIVALGVGFFAGLRICRDDMAETASGYLGRQNLFDYRLLSTVGFDDEAEKALEDDPAVSEAECAFACDACSERVPNIQVEPGHFVRCVRAAREEAIEKLLLSLSDGSWIEITDMEREEIPVDPKERDFRVRGY